MTDPYAADQPFYDAWNERDDDLEFWLTLAATVEGPILEIGVGTARVAAALAERGHVVTGIDTSPAMLAAARRRSAGLWLTLHQMDAARVDTCPGGPFDLVIAPNDAFLHACEPEDQRAWLAAIFGATAPHGAVALDLPGPSLWLDPQTNGEPLLVYHGGTGDGATLDVWQVHDDDPTTQRRRLTIIYDRTAPGGTLTRTYGEHELRYVYPREMHLLLERAGFLVEAEFGGYDFGPFETESERMIILARRPAP